MVPDGISGVDDARESIYRPGWYHQRLSLRTFSPAPQGPVRLGSGCGRSHFLKGLIVYDRYSFRRPDSERSSYVR